MSKRQPDLNSGKCYDCKGGGGGGGEGGKASNAKIIEFWACKRTLQFFHATEQ